MTSYVRFCLIALLSIGLLCRAAFAQMDSDFSGGGAIRVGDSTTGCPGNGGGIRFDANVSDGGGLQYCDGTNWLALLTSSFSGVVNNGNSFSAPMIVGTNDTQPLSFETDGTTRVTIDTSGNVGIGTTSPSQLLEVVGNNTAVHQIIKVRNDGTTGNSPAQVSVSSGRGVDANFYTYDTAAYVGTGTNHDFSIVSNNANRIRITASGDVGIGTTTPQSSLQVAGYTQLDTVAGTPPSGDCDAAAEYGRMKVDPATGENKLFICTADGWQTYQPGAGGGGGGGRTSCPAGFTLIGTSGELDAFCISTNEETSANWLTAVTNCSNKSPVARLCTASEWALACVKGTPNNMTGNWEWVADLNGVNGGGGHVMGSSGCISLAYGSLSASAASRCCFR